MKVFISADIEGVTTTTVWSECDSAKSGYAKCADMMTKEVVAACEGAYAAGATEIVVRDAHDSATNIDIHQLPEYVTLIRGWSGHPYSMVDGIDGSFDACMFVGYHSAASRCGNPLSHTYSGGNQYVKINGRIASEFTLYSYAAALEGVPTVFLSGDKMLCEDYKDLHPALITTVVKDGVGGLSVNYNPRRTLAEIRQNAEKALRQDLSKAKIELPKEFELEICYKKHAQAVEKSYFPGVERKGDDTLVYRTKNYYDLLTAFIFIA